MEVAGLETYSALQEHREARRELPTLLSNSKMRVKRLCVSVDRYSHVLSENSIRGAVLKKAGNEFDVINSQLQSLLAKRHITFKIPKHVENVRKCNEKLRALEHQIQIFGLVTQESMSLRHQIEKLVAATREILEAQGDSRIFRVLKTIDRTLEASDENNDAVNVVPKQARKLLNALSKSGLPDEQKNELEKWHRRSGFFKGNQTVIDTVLAVVQLVKYFLRE